MNGKIMTYNSASQQVFHPMGQIVPMLLVLLMLVLGGGKAWAQTDDTDYSGVYYIASKGKDITYNEESVTNNFYLCPTEKWRYYDATDGITSENNGKPFMTTYKCRGVATYESSKAIWIIEKDQDSGNYYIKHVVGNKTYYLTHNASMPSSTNITANRARLHLDESPSNDADALFTITYVSSIDCYDIAVTNAPNNNIYLNVNKGSQNYLHGSGNAEGGVDLGGIVGVWKDGSIDSTNGLNSRWYLERVYCATPKIEYDPDTHQLTMTSGTNGATIYYTLDGIDPTTDSSVYDDSNKPTITERTVVKAFATKTNKENSEVATQTVVWSPVINVASATYNGEEQEPAVTVFDGETEIPVVEYNVEYSNNVNAGENTAIVKITDKEGGDYIVYGTTTFTIEKATITPTVSIVGWAYGETPNEPTVEGNSGNGAVTYKYKASDAETYSETVPTDADDYMIIAIIAATTNTFGATTDPFEFVISPKSLGDGNKAAEGIDIQMEQVEDHVEVTSVKDGETPLVESKDYTVTIEEQGVDWIVIVSGIGNYSGSARGLFVHAEFIKAADADKAVAAYRAKTDLSKPAGTSIYIVRKVNPSLGTVLISSVDYLPKDVPVLMLRDNESTGFLASEKPDESVDGISEITAETKNSNLLQVSDGTVAVEAAQVYMYYNGVFVQTFKGILPSGSFYLYNPNYQATTSTTGDNAPLQMVIEGTTGIDDGRRMMEDGRGEKWYTLDGRCFSGKPTTKGLYINNGLKMNVK